MTEREAFEEFAKTHDMCLRTVDTMGGPCYSDCNTDYAWLAWQASRKQALEEEKPARLKAWETAWDACRKQTFEDAARWVHSFDTPEAHAFATAIRSLSQPTGGKE